MRQVQSGRPVALPSQAVDAHGMAQDLSRICRLLNGDVDDGSDPSGNVLTASLHCGMLVIFANLALRRLPQARQKLEIRQQHAIMTPSDWMAWAILHHLLGDANGARRDMQTALAAAAHFGSAGRLDFDLRLVPGMSVTSLMAEVFQISVPYLPMLSPPKGSLMSPDDEDLDMVGDSASMTDVRKEIMLAARDDDAPVLLVGETGSGKELASKLIHRSSRRSKRPFIAVNCAAVADDLLLAELFGHAKGAFTGSTGERGGLIHEAENGTIFLDEIGDASLRLQASLLRLIENNEYRRLGEDRVRVAKCRIITATNVVLDAACAQGRFRSDLLFRLNRFVIRLPPLRDHIEDLPMLIDHWLPGVDVDAVVVAAMRAHPWPGNVRELHHVCERIRRRHAGIRRLDMATWIACNPQIQRAEAPASLTARQPTLHGEERIGLLRSLFRDRGRMTRQEVMRHLNIAGTTATADLHALCVEGFIVKVEPNHAPRTHYFRLAEK
jgi:transcriptional regulator with AAA-type ATPase domain